MSVKYKRWDTPLSNCIGGLTFRRLVDGEVLLFEVEDNNGSLYEVVIDGGKADYAYLVRNEAYMTHKVNLKLTGCTYIVDGDDDFSKLMSSMTERAEWPGWEPYVHYVVSTWDSCLEVISNYPPVVRKI